MSKFRLFTFGRIIREVESCFPLRIHQLTQLLISCSLPSLIKAVSATVKMFLSFCNQQEFCGEGPWSNINILVLTKLVIHSLNYMDPCLLNESLPFTIITYFDTHIVPDVARGGSFKLASTIFLQVPELFLTFWHSRIFQTHLILSLSWDLSFL